jgi:hypothetical protein
LTERQVSASFRVPDVYGRFGRLHGKRRSSVSPSYLTGRGGSADVADERMTKEEKDAADQRDIDTAKAFRDRRRRNRQSGSFKRRHPFTPAMIIHNQGVPLVRLVEDTIYHPHGW